MTQSVSAGWLTEEAKNVGAEPKIYIAFMRDTWSISNADIDAGTFTNTERSGDNIQLSAGQAIGVWDSVVTDSEHLTPNVIYDKIAWTETLNGGTVSVQIRSAAASGDVTSQSFTAYTNGTLDHTARERYYQIRVGLVEGASSPTVSAISVRHKALIPKSDYISAGGLSYGIDIDFFNSSSGDLSVTLDNSSNQWEKNQAASYIYGITYYYEKIELWIGFDVSGSDEWLLQYLGEIESITTSSGINTDANATINSRDFFFRKLNNTFIGVPNSNGTPQPYMAGVRYRVPCKETDADTYVYTFYCQQAISSIDAVYVRDTNNQKWVTAPSNTPNAGAKTITFDADPGTEVAVDITIDANTHPCDILDDIYSNELSLSTDEYNSTDLATVKTRTSGLSVGVSFENIPVQEAVIELMKTLDGAVYVENGVLRTKNYWPDIESVQSFSESIILGTNFFDSIGEVQNTVSVFYGDYEDDKTQYLQIVDTESVTAYGTLTKDIFSFTFSDMVSMASGTKAEEIISHWIYHQAYQFEIYDVSLPLEILRTEIFDIVDITVTKHNLSSTAMLVLEKNIDYGEYEGSLKLIKYPDVQWMFYSDDADVADLYYFVDNSTSDPDYNSYMW